MTRETTILGVTYQGLPGMGTLAFALWKLEQDGLALDAQRLLDAHQAIVRVFGDGQPINLAEQMSDLPLEGLLTCPAR